ncbi:hypothetical protein PIROE2DRAFT_57045 [Piromyces sp. E2]|nr:hypothetical protein PIROE2DRAFT_57045 [Piromyces sp. E2]|eukprot:OUM69962.1 hypothetical protein PIROE2DRAFT_57045 [Piromyces sp. E2]
MPSIKKSLYILASALFLSKNVIADDCSYVERAINYMGNEFSKNYNVTDCCQFNGVKCNQDKSVTGLKLVHIKDDTANAAKIFEKIGQLKELTYLNLSNNNLATDTFPKEICGLSKLENLNLSNNRISGVIPYDCKNLQNLQQLNLAGNKDLSGYVPILNNLKGCVYENTGLCYLPNAACRNSKTACNADQVRNTNAANGNPDPTSYMYEGMEKSRDMNVYNDAQYYNTYDTSAYSNYDPNTYAYDSNYGYDNGYGYGYGYDDSYYGNGYNYGYDNGYYGSSGYGSGYGYDTYDYSGYGYTGLGGSTGGSGSSPFTSLFSIILYCVFFAVALFVCCACCCCGACAGGKDGEKPFKTFGHNFGHHSTNHTTTTAGPFKPSPYKPAQHTVNMEQDITNTPLPPYSMPQPKPQMGGYPPKPQMGGYPPKPQMGYPQNPNMGYGYKRGVDEVAEVVEDTSRAVETAEHTAKTVENTAETVIKKVED